MIAAIQAYTILTAVRCIAEPHWIVHEASVDKSGSREDPSHLGTVSKTERWFLAFSIVFTLISCTGVTLRVLDKLAWLRRTSVLGAYLQCAFSAAAMSSFLRSHQLPPGYQYSHGFLACVITIVLSLVVAIMLTIDWRQGFPSAGLSATLKALIISSFMMTIVIIIGAVVYSWLEGWTFDESVNFCIVSFSTIGYGNLSPRSVAGRVFFFFYGILGVSAIGFFIVSLRNAVVEQFQWRLIEQFSRPAHINRVQTRMSVKDLSYPMACLEEEVRVKTMVKRKMILGMIVLWLLFWFGGAGVFCAFEKWTFLESLYFCYVTLTTIGFGDYVPNEPGSIEFWNIYVFIGLTIFAYILSLFSESMSSHFQLVDDVVVDEDEDLYGWEQCDGDLHTSDAMGRKGILGLEGYEWYRQNQQRRIPGHRPQYGGDSKAELSSKNPSGSQTKDQDHSTRQSLGGGIYATDGVGAGRVLEVPAKASRQMSQAEYYAAHGGSSIGFSDNDNSPNSACMPSPADTMSTQYRHYDSLGNAAWRRSNDTMRLDSPTTIRTPTSSQIRISWSESTVAVATEKPSVTKNAATVRK
ncbi:Potassium channel [Mortierella sp. GBA43]|nr:Potassium channel [Mortierella sp. GBA43]